MIRIFVFIVIVMIIMVCFAIYENMSFECPKCHKKTLKTAYTISDIPGWICKSCGHKTFFKDK